MRSQNNNIVCSNIFQLHEKNNVSFRMRRVAKEFRQVDGVVCFTFSHLSVHVYMMFECTVWCGVCVCVCVYVCVVCSLCGVHVVAVPLLLYFCMRPYSYWSLILLVYCCSFGQWWAAWCWGDCCWCWYHPCYWLRQGCQNRKRSGMATNLLLLSYLSSHLPLFSFAPSLFIFCLFLSPLY